MELLEPMGEDGAVAKFLKTRGPGLHHLAFETGKIGEEMRRVGVASTPLAALSRAMAGVRGRTLIINVPGSLKGATESLEAAMPLLAHAVQLLRGDTTHR